jgi:hypothetical protein
MTFHSLMHERFGVSAQLRRDTVQLCLLGVKRCFHNAGVGAWICAVKAFRVNHFPIWRELETRRIPSALSAHGSLPPLEVVSNQ